MDLELELEKDILDEKKVKEFIIMPEDDFRYGGKLKNDEQYNLIKDLLKDTCLSKFFNDAYPSCAVQQKRNFENGCFIHLRTGINSDQHISFVIKDNELSSYYAFYQNNYEGYNCYCTPDLIIHEEIGYGFGSWKYNNYDLNGNIIDKKSKQEYGSCCD